MRSKHKTTIENILNILGNDYVIIHTFDEHNQPITYRKDDHNNIPDNILNGFTSNFNAYTTTMCDKEYTVLETDILF